MESSESLAIVGKWRDFTTGELLLTVPQPWGIITIAVAGIWVSWSVKYMKKLLGNLVLWVHLHRHKSRPRPRNNGDDTEESLLLGDRSHTSKRKDAQPLAIILKEKSGVRDLFAESLTSKTLDLADKGWLLLFTLLISALASSMIVGGYFSTRVKLDGPARIASERCGLWVFDGEKRSDAATRAGLLDLEKEERAAQFAEDCYGKSSSIARRCNVLYRPKLPVRPVKYTNDCPFQNKICRQNQTVTFSTPLIDASDIGIHSPMTPKFRRSTTCTPLSMEYPYIQNFTEHGTTTYYYYYGEKSGEDPPVNYTYKTIGDPWDRLAPVYDVFAYASNADDSDDAVWRPRAELTVPKYSTLTILFISSLRILYKERSDDPIFPANETWAFPGDPKPWFRNSDPRARPLACINTIEVCSPDETMCWNVNAPSNSGIPDETAEFTLLYAALFKTDIYFSIAKRQGRGLQAQKVVAQYFSETLGDDPWVREVESLVTTSLARTQINAWSVASGEDSVHEGKDGYISLTDKYGDLCGKFKYNPLGYHSLRFIPFVVMLCSVPALLLLSLEWKPIEKRVIKILGKAKGVFDDLLLKLKVRLAGSRQESNDEELDQSPQNSPSPPNAAADESSAGDVSAPDNDTDDDTTAATQGQNQSVSPPGANQASVPETSDISDKEEIVWKPLLWMGLLKLLVLFLCLIVKVIWWMIRGIPKVVRYLKSLLPTSFGGG
ncbi:hypothetical protein CC80DRAFT_488398 [Byssothecium circinans]|uniref:Uncharacterized protein n=1 Tax=Byssothecium circinans TaxID=147558 RepID=A0A6A5UDK3_9PLEO|nr:hypothetical protein CC80DRAFT_488398 [Byssothecium circinans]